ncbi:MAG TPA: hypothetical protein VFV99_03985 [Kofleriaceae bacterium]|nr:hypothetical protein [Kofleriaceae bacterium]
MRTVHMTKKYITVALFVAACGGKAPATQKPETETPPPADMAFKDMNADQRMAFMKHTVLPAMKQTFSAFDPKFANMNCKTCHGKGAEDGSFEMPNPDLPRLPKPDAFMAFAQDPKHAPWVKFMIEKVEPEMANLLKMKPFDPQTNTGDFSCHACHLTEGEEAKKD